MFICKHYWTVISLNEDFMFFDRETRSTLWNHLNINIPWMNMEVWETSIVSKLVFSQGCTVNTYSYLVRFDYSVIVLAYTWDGRTLFYHGNDRVMEVTCPMQMSSKDCLVTKFYCCRLCKNIVELYFISLKGKSKFSET